MTRPLAKEVRALVRAGAVEPSVDLLLSYEKALQEAESGRAKEAGIKQILGHALRYPEKGDRYLVEDRSLAVLAREIAGCLTYARSTLREIAFEGRKIADVKTRADWIVSKAAGALQVLSHSPRHVADQLKADIEAAEKGKVTISKELAERLLKTLEEDE